MAGTVEPTASMGVAPRARMAGVVTTAPPMPNMPESTPDANPSTTVAALAQLTQSSTREVSGPQAHPSNGTGADTGRPGTLPAPACPRSPPRRRRLGSHVVPPLLRDRAWNSPESARNDARSAGGGRLAIAGAA